MLMLTTKTNRWNWTRTARAAGPGSGSPLAPARYCSSRSYSCWRPVAGRTRAAGAGGGGGPPAVGKTRPAAPPENKISALDLHSYYFNSPNRSHPLTGKRAVVKLSAVQTYMTADGLDQPAILYASQGGFSRPPIIVRLGSRRGYENGKPASPDARKDVLVDALFKGLVPFDGTGWQKSWSAMPGSSVLPPDSIILFDDGELTGP